ncbi:site-specific integrase [Metamycoplasma hyosynoviae]|uniref:site-specific integrase n=1 Tax=Metamycoplasma hyosynoviae TaxID=29559 RepID=UPI0020C91277|nr:site-specific integrase [Metamycoplasma hyosynoviae]MDC8921375.1 site-specific integrase [Metamycoplasma hyosynoviae]UTO27114.1 site-specific integrase [Metamycoplasma hyosynoviae]
MKNIEQLEIFYAEFEKSISTNNRSAKTLATYKFFLNKLTNWKTIDELLNQINFILDNSNLCTNSLFTIRAIYRSFCEWFSKRNRVYIPFNERINKYRIERGTRRSYTKEELTLLLNELKLFGSYKFEIIFKILLTTGVRVSELENVNWEALKANNYEIIIKTSKNNNPRAFRIINSDNEIFKDIREAIDNGINLNIKTKTIKNYFQVFQQYVLNKHKDFKNKISAHILRHTFVTLSAENHTIEEISKILGHVNSSVTASTYLTYNPTLANKKLSEMQHNISNFLIDTNNKNNEIDLNIENQKLRKEIANLKAKLEQQNNNFFSLHLVEEHILKHKN